MMTFVWEISEKSTNFEVSVSNFKSRSRISSLGIFDEVLASISKF